MYKQKRSLNRRRSSTDSYRSTRRGYGGGWKSGSRQKNRFKESIAHSMYISKAIENVEEGKYKPSYNFSEFGLHFTLYKNILGRNYTSPTKIQDKVISDILNGSDILGLASTGSGKTGAFLIPMIDKVLKKPGNKVLILTPTRELANQIKNEFMHFSTNTPLRIALVIGGQSIRTQMSALQRNPQFVVATPGRLMDLEKRRAIDLSKFNNVVLDEVDQMLAMGFVDDIRKIIAKLPSEKQSLFFSATMSYKEEIIANELLNNPIKVQANKISPLKSIDQDIVKVSSSLEKIQMLQKLVSNKDFIKVLIFSETKRGADDISNHLKKGGIRVDSLHGDKSQNVRSRVLDSFRNDRINVLVATDVAARGIDIPNITHVINYDEPNSYNDYIHRIGRTGRIGKKGTALTFVLT